jgi:hypothetical protein
VARARRHWIREQGLLDPARLVFIDETATSTSLVRLRGRCPRGERLVGSVPHGHWKTITLVVGLRHDGMVAPFVIDGPNERDEPDRWIARPRGDSSSTLSPEPRISGLRDQRSYKNPANSGPYLREFSANRDHRTGLLRSG